MLSTACSAIGRQQTKSLIAAASIFDLLRQDVSAVLVAVPEGASRRVFLQLVQDAKQLGGEAIFCSNGFQALTALTASLEPEERSKCCVLRFECSKNIVNADLTMLDGACKQRLLNELSTAQLTLSAVGHASTLIGLDSVGPAIEPAATIFDFDAVASMSDADLGQLVSVRTSRDVLAGFIGSSVALPALLTLDLSGGQIDDATLALFCEWITRGHCPSLRHLDLSHNLITTVGMNALARQLTHSAFARLTHLDLLFNHDDSKFDELAKAVRIDHTGGLSIREWILRLCRCRPRSSTRYQAERACPPLAELRVLRVAMHSASHALALERAMRGGALPSLTRLDMRHGYTLDIDIDGQLARAKGKLLRLDGVHVTY